MTSSDWIKVVHLSGWILANEAGFRQRFGNGDERAQLYQLNIAYSDM
jgi:hypothetical protein